jgi:hypothetical protein
MTVIKREKYGFCMLTSFLKFKNSRIQGFKVLRQRLHQSHTSKSYSLRSPRERKYSRKTLLLHRATATILSAKCDCVYQDLRNYLLF